MLFFSILFSFNLATRAFSLLTRGFELVTCKFELVTCGFKFVTREFELVTHGFELVTTAKVSLFVTILQILKLNKEHCSFEMQFASLNLT